jgi:hypothetical protein
VGEEGGWRGGGNVGGEGGVAGRRSCGRGGGSGMEEELLEGRGEEWEGGGVVGGTKHCSVNAIIMSGEKSFPFDIWNLYSRYIVCMRSAHSIILPFPINIFIFLIFSVLIRLFPLQKVYFFIFHMLEIFVFLFGSFLYFV